MCLKSPFLAIFPQINFLGTPQIFYPPKIFRPPQIFFTLLDVKILFLDFIDLKNLF